MNKRLWFALAVSIWMMVACGGGGTNGGSDSELTAGVGSGGTGSFSGGPITNLGSIVVNGIHFDQGTAQTITDMDGGVHAASDLKLGMVVELDASDVVVSGGRLVASAHTIRIASTLFGAVDEVGSDGLTVMGQTVRVLASTQFGSALPSKLTSLKAGDVVEVYGLHDAKANVFVATRIERSGNAAPDHYTVQGAISDLDVAANRCRIGQQLIVGAWKSVPAGLHNGQVARARLYPTLGSVTVDGAPTKAWMAQDMALTTPLIDTLRDAYVDGLVTDITDAAKGLFSVNGISVNAGTACSACAGLQVGARLSVRGRLNNGVIAASDVRSLGAY
jgi:hypothetical protein